MQVVSADGTKPYAMFFSIRGADALPRNPEIRFMETPEGAPPAVKTWWNPGETIGREFIYPKEQARRLARNSSVEPGSYTTGRTRKPPDNSKHRRFRQDSSSNGQELATSAADKPTPSAPSGRAQQGEAAPESIPIKPPKVPNQA